MKIPLIPCKLLKFLFITLLFLPVVSRADDKTLTCATNLAETLKDVPYGSKKDQIDCDRFVAKVVECRLNHPLSNDVRQAILMSYNWDSNTVQTLAKEGTDPRIGGVQYALTRVSNEGKTISPADAKPGYLLQYWMPHTNGVWFGHSAVIVSMKGTRATILSASETLKKIG